MVLITDILNWLDLSRLIKRLVEEDGLGDVEYVTAVIDEYKRFFILFSCFCNLNEKQMSNLFVPSLSVDIVWQRHMLDTIAYMEDCKKWGIHTNYLHRFQEEVINLNQGNGESDMDMNMMRNGYKCTMETYEAVFGTVPPINIWSKEFETSKTFISYTYYIHLISLFNY